MMHGNEKSDSAIVAVKPTNKAGQPAAEPVEPRAGTKGNASQQSTRRAHAGRKHRVRAGIDLCDIRPVASDFRFSPDTAADELASPDLALERLNERLIRTPIDKRR